MVRNRRYDDERPDRIGRDGRGYVYFPKWMWDRFIELDPLGRQTPGAFIRELDGKLLQAGYVELEVEEQDGSSQSVQRSLSSKTKRKAEVATTVSDVAYLVRDLLLTQGFVVHWVPSKKDTEPSPALSNKPCIVTRVLYQSRGEFDVEPMLGRLAIWPVYKWLNARSKDKEFMKIPTDPKWWDILIEILRISRET